MRLFIDCCYLGQCHNCMNQGMVGMVAVDDEESAESFVEWELCDRCLGTVFDNCIGPLLIEELRHARRVREPDCDDETEKTEYRFVVGSTAVGKSMCSVYTFLNYSAEQQAKHIQSALQNLPTGEAWLRADDKGENNVSGD